MKNRLQNPRQQPIPFPYQIVIGDKEKQENKVAVRRKAEDLGSLDLDDFIAQLQQEITDALVNH